MLFSEWACGAVQDVQAARCWRIASGASRIVGVHGWWGDEELVEVVEDDGDGGEVFGEPGEVAPADDVAGVGFGGVFMWEGTCHGDLLERDAEVVGVPFEVDEVPGAGVS